MRVVALAIFALSLAATAIAEEASLPAAVVGPAVSRDGDDLVIGPYKIRLWGIDAPEMNSRAGHRARAVLGDLISGRLVRCEPVDRDRYGRLVSRCSTVATPDLGEAMLRAGAAVVYRRFTVGSEFAERYDAAEKAAREAGIGVWTVAQAPVPGADAAAIARAVDALERLAVEAEKWDWKDWLPVAVAFFAALIGGLLAVAGFFIGNGLERRRVAEKERDERRQVQIMILSELFTSARTTMGLVKLIDKTIASKKRYRPRDLQLLIGLDQEPPIFSAAAALLHRLTGRQFNRLYAYYLWLRTIRRDALETLATAEDAVPPDKLLVIRNRYARACASAAEALRQMPGADDIELGPTQSRVDDLIALLEEIGGRITADEQ